MLAITHLQKRVKYFEKLLKYEIGPLCSPFLNVDSINSLHSLNMLSQLIEEVGITLDAYGHHRKDQENKE
ncbi:UNKNOWN [Stylonychia lemnae]|uniref:Uncharacterized protein n=1 Tax=Stylonychia lemnae TaxID=5949 RepID=A0A078ACX4_STYLE|nr:UNKNOWN [Stylonychia lemnae]|eukprot:CDW80064.1 UNKNOWN [Stylonychia lemnae]